MWWSAPLLANTPSVCLPIIGVHHSPLTQKFGTPRQSRLVNIKSHITLHAPFDTLDDNGNLLAMTGFGASHLWVLWHSHLADKTINAHQKPSLTVRPPRLGGNARLGVFATRSNFRPSPICLSVVRFLGVDGTRILIEGADFIDGTPILDIKPYLPYADSIDAQFYWDNQSNAVDAPTTRAVRFSDDARMMANDLTRQGLLSNDDLTHISALIAHDPRPAYHADARHYHLCYGKMAVRFYFDGTAFVIDNIVMDNNNTPN